MHFNQQDPLALTSILMNGDRRSAVSLSIALAQAGKHTCSLSHNSSLNCF